MRRIGTAERRARLGRLHHLAPSSAAASVAEVARSLVGLHSTDPTAVYLATAARCPTIDPDTISTALYDDRSIVRLLGMRRTVWVVPVDLVSVIHAACTRSIAARERRHLLRQLTQANLGDEVVGGIGHGTGGTGDGEPRVGGGVGGGGDGAGAERWLTDLEAATLAEITARGEATGAEVSAAVPGLREQLSYGDETKLWAGRQALATRVLFLLAADERIVRGRPRGSWTSTQYRWAPLSAWLPDGVADLDGDEARATLARRWLAAFGPATVADVRWWTGWTATETRSALGAAGVVEVELERGTGLILADEEPDHDGDTAINPAVDAAVDPGVGAADGHGPAEPWVALLPALDPTTMGWLERSWYLGPHGPALFDRTGNAGPTVWADGRVVGGWAQRRDGEVVFRLLEDVGTEVTDAVATAADRLSTWLGGVRVKPRFRTPLERELSG
jgi:hypothetical protein